MATVQHCLRASILRPAGNVVANRNRALLAVGYGSDARRIDAVAGQEIADGLRPLGSQRDVVFPRSPFVGMTFNRNRVLGVLLQPARLICHRLLRFWRQIHAIRREIDQVAGIYGEVPGRAWRRRAILVVRQIFGPRVVGAGGNTEAEDQGRAKTHDTSTPSRMLHVWSLFGTAASMPACCLQIRDFTARQAY